MLVQVFSCSVIIFGLYLLFQFFRQTEIPKPFVFKTEHHMGCYSAGNDPTHSEKLEEFLAGFQSLEREDNFEMQEKQLASNVKYTEVSKWVGIEFEKYLNEYYRIKTKGVYEQNFYNSLNLAEDQYQKCKKSVLADFNKENCVDTQARYNASAKQFEYLKSVLSDKIEGKQKQQRKIASLILNTNFADEEQIERNLTNQIDNLNDRLQMANNHKIQLLNKKAPIDESIRSNKSQLEADSTLLNECLANQKIIRFCNQLNEQLKAINFVYTKKDIQKRIQRKKNIISAIQHAKKSAQKLKDSRLIESNELELNRNKQQLVLLEARIDDFQTQEESYCLKCSVEKIEKLKIDVANAQSMIIHLKQQYDLIIGEEKEQDERIDGYRKQIDRLEEERQFNINNNICITEECQQARSQNIKDEGSILNERKKQVLDHRYELEEHKLEHKKRVADLNTWILGFDSVIDCLYKKEYFQKLRQHRPQHNENEVLKINSIKEKLKRRMEQLTDDSTLQTHHLTPRQRITNEEEVKQVITIQEHTQEEDAIIPEPDALSD